MKIFVSYSWINEKPDDNVLNLVATLRENGYNAVCDVILSQCETAINFSKMMAENLQKADKIIIVLTEKYKKKADSFTGGVGEEYQYIIEDIKNKKQKYILVSFDNDRNKVTPDFLRGRELIFLDKTEILCDSLLHKIIGTSPYIFPHVSSNMTKPAYSFVQSLKKTKASKKYYEDNLAYNILNKQTDNVYLDDKED